MSRLDDIRYALLKADHKMSGWLSPWHIREDMRWLYEQTKKLKAIREAAMAVESDRWETAEAPINAAQECGGQVVAVNLDEYVLIRVELLDKLKEVTEGICNE